MFKEVFSGNGGEFLVEAGECKCECGCPCICDCQVTTFLWWAEGPGMDDALSLYNWESGQKPGTMG